MHTTQMNVTHGWEFCAGRRWEVGDIGSGIVSLRERKGDNGRRDVHRIVAAQRRQRFSQ